MPPCPATPVPPGALHLAGINSAKEQLGLSALAWAIGFVTFLRRWCWASCPPHSTSMLDQTCLQPHRPHFWQPGANTCFCTCTLQTLGRDTAPQQTASHSHPHSLAFLPSYWSMLQTVFALAPLTKLTFFNLHLCPHCIQGGIFVYKKSHWLFIHWPCCAR